MCVGFHHFSSSSSSSQIAHASAFIPFPTESIEGIRRRVRARDEKKRIIISLGGDCFDSHHYIRIVNPRPRRASDTRNDEVQLENIKLSYCKSLIQEENHRFLDSFRQLKEENVRIFQRYETNTSTHRQHTNLH